MAHLQYNGKRISGEKVGIGLKQSLQLELWGPQKDGGGEFLVISSDDTAVSVEPGAAVSARNVKLYKVTGNGLSAHVRIEIVAGEVADAKAGLVRSNIKQPYISCDHIHMSVHPASGVVYADYFAEVIPGIAEGIAEYNSLNTPLVNKAGFLLIQTYNEQSPGFSGPPSQHGNRMFNVQALVQQLGGGKIGPALPGQEEPGVTIRNLAQGEGKTNATRVMKTSPTFYYESPKRAVTHYFKMLKERYPKAYAVITDRDGSFSQFAYALKAHGFAIDASYAETMISTAGQVLRQGKAWVDYELKAIDHDLAVATMPGDTESLTKERDRMVDFQKQLSSTKL